MPKWYKNGVLHREDAPAVVLVDGTKEWYRNGLLHREDGPAVEKTDGTKEWYLNGLLHREDGPAVEKTDGTKKWYRLGKLFLVEFIDGTQVLYRSDEFLRREGLAIIKADVLIERMVNGKPHQQVAPSVAWGDAQKEWYRNGNLFLVEFTDGRKEWYQNGALHREEGPAIINADGTKAS